MLQAVEYGQLDAFLDEGDWGEGADTNCDQLRWWNTLRQVSDNETELHRT